MQGSLNLTKLMNEDEVTDNLLFHCSVCDLRLTTKNEWIYHANGRAHISKELKTSNIRHNADDLRNKIVAQCKQLLGNQKKFVKIAVEENLWVFACVLCDIRMTSYFALNDHLNDDLHKTKVREYEMLKEGGKNEVTTSDNEKALSEKCGNFELESIVQVDHLTRDCDLNLQGLKNAVEELSKFFSGRLKCTNCQLNIVVDPSTIADHLHDCLLKEDQKKAVSADTKNIKDKFCTLLQDATAGNEILLENLQLVSDRPVPRDDEVEQCSFAAVLRSLQADTMRASIMKPRNYECLMCDKNGSINKWEEHVTKHHIISSIKPRNDLDLDNVVCLCTLCQLMIFGRRKDVIKHEHFGAKNDCLFFPFSSYPPLKNVLDCNHQLPKYYKCLQKLAPVNGMKLAFYCLPCDVYGFEKSRQHFQSKDHQLKSYPVFEFYYCAVCSILFYADRLLFEDHRRTPSHILSKFVMKPNVIRASVDFVSKSHEDLLSNLKTSVLKHWIAQPWNNRHPSAFWCESCAYFTDKEEEWRSVHLTSETHAVKVRKGYFEHMCLLCKVRLFGSPEFHAAHYSSEGHKNIKGKVFRDLNRRRMMKKRSSVRFEVESANEKQMTSPISTMNDDSSDDNESNNRKQTQLFKCPTVEPIKDSNISAVVYDDKSYDLENDPYLQKLDCSITVDKKLIKQFLEKIIKKCGPFGRVKNYFCAFCNYYSSEKSWWSHMESSEHKTICLSEGKSKKSKQVNIIFCSQCSLFGLGDHVMRRIHKNSRTHKKMSARAKSTKKMTSSSSPISFLSTTDDDDENSAILNGRQQTTTVCPSIDTTNVPGGADSSDDERNEIENSEDELYDMIMREESDVEKMTTSDDELDKSVLEEIRSNTVQNLSVEERIDKYGNELENRVSVENIEYSIVVSGIPKPVMRNRALLKEAFSRYVQFDRTFVKKSKPDSIHLVVSKDLHGSFRRLKENIGHLMARWGTDELSVHLNSEEKSELLAIKEQLLEPAVILFSNKQELFNAITHMTNLYDAEANSTHANRRINELLTVISRLAVHIYREYNVIVKTHVFGSRITGLAVENSDVDVYLQIGASFRGLISNNTELQQQLVVLFSKEMRSHPYDFGDITSIPFARVPIVKFKHIKSNLNCDLSFKSGLSTMNSILVKTYLELDERIKFVVCAIKLWMKLNELADRNLFTTYAQIWMVLFFLMQAEIAVVPTVIKLKNMLPPEQQILTVEGWNCSFPSIRNIVWRSSCTLTGEELVHRFFIFYSDILLNKYVLCTLTGLKLEKKHFIKYYDSLPEAFGTFKLRIMEDPTLFRKVLCDFESFCIQDPFDHCHNLTKTINVRKFTTFVELCKQTTELLKR